MPKMTDRRAFLKLIHAYRYVETQHYLPGPEGIFCWDSEAAKQARQLLYQAAWNHPGKHNHGGNHKGPNPCPKCSLFWELTRRNIQKEREAAMGRVVYNLLCSLATLPKVEEGEL